MSDPQQALMNLVLLAHAEIRALRDVVELLVAAGNPADGVNPTTWLLLEADFRRKHLEAMGLPLDRFDELLSQAIINDVAPTLSKPSRDGVDPSRS